jgi:biotin carboxyl carrier protein
VAFPQGAAKVVAEGEVPLSSDEEEEAAAAAADKQQQQRPLHPDEELEQQQAAEAAEAAAAQQQHSDHEPEDRRPEGTWINALVSELVGTACITCCVLAVLLAERQAVELQL